MLEWHIAGRNGTLDVWRPPACRCQLGYPIRWPSNPHLILDMRSVHPPDLGIVPEHRRSQLVPPLELLDRLALAGPDRSIAHVRGDSLQLLALLLRKPGQAVVLPLELGLPFGRFRAASEGRKGRGEDGEQKAREGTHESMISCACMNAFLLATLAGCGLSSPVTGLAFYGPVRQPAIPHMLIAALGHLPTGQ